LTKKTNNPAGADVRPCQ